MPGHDFEDRESRPFDPAVEADLRRRRQRDMVEHLLDRAACLPPDDLALLRAVYADGRTAVELAALMRCDARALRRRIRRLVERLLSPRFLFVLRHRDGWSATRKRVATACVLHGRSLREAAAELRLSLHTVRRHLDAVNALFETIMGSRHAG